MTLHLCLFSQREDDLQDPAAHQPQLCLCSVHSFTLLHCDSITQLMVPTCEQTVDDDEPLQLSDVTKLSTETCRWSLEAAMLELSCVCSSLSLSVSSTGTFVVNVTQTSYQQTRNTTSQWNGRSQPQLTLPPTPFLSSVS